MTQDDILHELLEVSNTMTRPVFRGQADADWKAESGALRRLRNVYGSELPTEEDDIRRLVDEYHRQELIMPMQVIDGVDKDDLARLSVLQHHGAATGLLDFTENPLIALWFGCGDISEKDARILVLDIGDPQVARNGRGLKDPFGAEQHVVYYEPDQSLGPRIIAQRSVFVVCSPFLPKRHLKSLIVPRDTKDMVRLHLSRLGLSQTALFGDIPGLAVANSTDKPLQRIVPLLPLQSRVRGNRAYQSGLYNDALDAYKVYAAERPHIAEPHCLVGDAFAALGRFTEADQAYTTAIGNLDRPIHPDDRGGASLEFWRFMLSNGLYYNRGNARAACADHLGAVEDFDFALQHGYGPRFAIMVNRGNSKFALGMFTKAYEDFEAVWLESKTSGTALAMGNCKVMTGDFTTALQRYSSGFAVPPEGAADHCRANAEQVRRILDLLDGRAFQIRHSNTFLFVETSNVRGKDLPFPFAGNQGNTGNTPLSAFPAGGGEGYEGAVGFTIVVVPTTP